MNPVAAGLAAVWLLGLTLVAQTPGPQVAPRPNDPFFNADLAPKPHVRALSPAEELKTFLLPPGYRLEPVLTEPDVQEPMQIAFDGNGRMFVLENRGYMQDADATGELDPVGRISVHEDADNDGVYEKHTVFLDKLVFPRFVLPFGPNSILTMESNTDDVFRFTDTNGDGVADKKELFTTNFGRSGNVEHQQSSLFLSMDNWMYTTYNTFRVRWTPKGVLREPTGTNNGQWGITQDNDGKVYFQTGEGGVPTYFQFPIHYGTFNMPGQLEPGLTTPWGVTGLGDYQPGTNAIRQGELTLGRVTGGAGNDVYRGDRLPADLVGDYIYGEPVARIVRRLTPVVTEGITQLRQVYQWQHAEFIRSADPLFRPVDMATAPDGTLYIVDTYRGIIQEGNWTRPGSYLRAKIDQYGLDKIVRHGRIWRLTYDGIARDRTPPRMNGEPPAQLVGRLSHPNGWWRDTAQQLLILKQDRSVVPALRQLARSGSSVHERIHALWTLEGLGALDAALARELIKDPNPKIRIHAVRTSETLYKDGDKSLGNEYRALLGDSDVDVVIQAMLTLNLFKVPDLAALVKAAQERTPARGVREVGNRILMPPAVGRGGRGRTPEETALLERGETIYKELCTTCHGTDGLGTPKEGAPAGTTMAPALSGSRRVQDHRDYVIKSLLHGLTGPVDGDTYTEVMVPMGTNKDDWIAAVASYVRTGFGNTGSIVTTADVARVRQATAARKAPWTVEELTKLLPTLVAVQPTWKVSASHNPATAGYGLNYIAWSTGEPQKPGMWFQIELPEPLMLTELVFDTTSGGRGGVPTGAFAIAGPVPGGTPLPSATPTTPAPDPAAARAGGPPAPPVQGYPREYKIEVSLDGTKWTAAAIGMGEPGTITVAFAPVRARFVRITQTGDVPGAPPWSIQRLRVYQAPSAR